MALFGRPRQADILDGMAHYLVDTPDGSVGVVDGWDRDEHGRPQTLIVAQGWFGRRRFEIPLEALVEVDHEDRRIIVARDAAPLERKRPLRRLVELGQDRSAEGAATVQRSSDNLRPVLCGIADDGLAPAVVSVAARLARTLASPLILAHATPAHVPPGVSTAPGGQTRLHEEEREDAEALMDGLLSGLVLDTAVKRIIARGAPAETLEELASTEGAQLLVIGATGRGSLGALFRGSVSQHVIGHAPCPVVVVPPDLTRPDNDEDDSSPSRILLACASNRRAGSAVRSVGMRAGVVAYHSSASLFGRSRRSGLIAASL